MTGSFDCGSAVHPDKSHAPLAFAQDDGFSEMVNFGDCSTCSPISVLQTHFFPAIFG
jgi:hypothetical protein